MSELACNIVLYRPDPNVLASRFRYWHVERLLNEADALINRCLGDFKEYSALDYAWNMFETELEAQEGKLGLYSRAPQEEPVPPTEPELATTEEDSAHVGGGEEVPHEEARPAEAEPVLGLAEPPGIRSSLDVRAEAVQRKRELSGPGRPFALNEQRDLVLARLCRDYEEAVNRAHVADEGLQRLYDHTGATSPLPSEAETLGASISNLSIWIRNSIEWLAGYHRHEQPFTRVVSVRALMNRNSWAILKHSRESYSTRVQIPVELFRGHDNCHLRGVGAYLLGEAGAIPWSVVVRLPEEAVYDRWGQSLEVDQSRRAPCLLGRVESHRSARAVEICGAMSWYDASPVGRPTQGGMWSIEIIKPFGVSSESFHHLEDLILELKVVGIPKKGSD